MTTKEIYVVKKDGYYFQLEMDTLYNSRKLTQKFFIMNLARAKEIKEDVGGNILRVRVTEEQVE